MVLGNTLDLEMEDTTLRDLLVPLNRGSEKRGGRIETGVPWCVLLYLLSSGFEG